MRAAEQRCGEEEAKLAALREETAALRVRHQVTMRRVFVLFSFVFVFVSVFVFVFVFVSIEFEHAFVNNNTRGAAC
jgi:hypothetical protein